VTRAGGGFQLPGQIGATKGLSSKAYRTPPIPDVHRVFACSVTTAAAAENARELDRVVDRDRAELRVRHDAGVGTQTKDRGVLT
jgi:hypothetical protein